MHSLPIVVLALQLADIHLQLRSFLNPLLQDLSLSFALVGDFIEFFKFLLVGLTLFFGFVLGFLQFHKIHTHVIGVFSLFLEFHLLVTESFFKVGHLLVVGSLLLASLVRVHLLLLQEHLLLHSDLF